MTVLARLRERLARLLAPHLMDEDEAVEWVQGNCDVADVFEPLRG